MMIALVGTSSSCATMAAGSPVVALGLTPSATELIVVSNAKVELLSKGDSTTRREIKSELDYVRAFAFNISGDRLALVGGIPGELGAVKLLAWPSGKLLTKRELAEDWLTTVAWRNDGSQLFVGGHDGSGRLLNVPNLKVIQSWSAHEKGVTDGRFLPTGKQLVTTGVDGILRVWDVATGIEVRSLNNHAGMIHAIALRDAEGLPVVCTVGHDRTVRFWQPTIGRMVRFAKLPWQPLAVTWLGDDRVAVTGEKGRLAIIEYATASIVFDKPLLSHWGYAVAAEADGIWLGGEKGEVRRHDVSAFNEAK